MQRSRTTLALFSLISLTKYIMQLLKQQFLISVDMQSSTYPLITLLGTLMPSKIWTKESLKKAFKPKKIMGTGKNNHKGALTCKSETFRVDF